MRFHRWGSWIAAFLSTACVQRDYNHSGTQPASSRNSDCIGGTKKCRNDVSPWPLSEPSCKRNRDDRFELGGVIRFGAYAKQRNPSCIDKSHVRPALILSPQDAKIFGFQTDFIRSDYSESVRRELLETQFSSLRSIVVANVEDIDDQLMVAEIPIDAIEDVFMHIERFDLGPIDGAHSQLRIVFSKPVRFRPQFPAGNTAPVTEAYDLILTINGVRTEGTPFDPMLLGVSDAYANGWGVVTSRERYLDSYLRQKNLTEQWRLRLNESQAKKVVLSFFHWSEFWEYRRVYHTYLQSCGTEQFYNLDSAIGGELGVKAPPAFVPYLPKEAQNDSSSQFRAAWDAPVFFKLDKGAQQVVGKFLVNLPGDAVADMFPLHAADGLFGAGGPLRDRKLIAAGDSDRAENFEDQSVSDVTLARVQKFGSAYAERLKLRVARMKTMHAGLCQMAQNRLSEAPKGSWAELTWSKTVANCKSTEN